MWLSKTNRIDFSFWADEVGVSRNMANNKECL